MLGLGIGLGIGLGCGVGDPRHVLMLAGEITRSASLAAFDHLVELDLVRAIVSDDRRGTAHGSLHIARCESCPRLWQR